LLSRPEIPSSLASRDALKRLPLRAATDDLSQGAPFFAELLAHPSDDGFWDAVDVGAHADEIDVPAFHIGAWYDAFQYDTLTLFSRLRTGARTPSARDGQRLLMGPWGHLLPFSTPTTGGAGDIDFGPEAKVELLAFQLEWLDHVLKGAPAPASAPVRIFVMGPNQWRDEQEWPLARAQDRSLFLRSGGGANGAGGDGALSETAPADEPADRFVYDPQDPVPTRGGAGLARALGAHDQREIEARADVLVYTGPVLEEALEVTGPVRVELFAASSAPDTDFTAKLVDVRPDGYAQNIVDGIIRARFRKSRAAPELMRPGEVCRFEIDLWATSHVFMPGHRLRLEISSSNFPRYDRNPNTGGAFGADAELARAEQTVFHDAARASRLILPVVPGSAS
jgi:hypothetical protein